MKASELKGQSDDLLAQTLRDTEKHLFQLRFQSATDRLETPSEISKAKRDIARIKTEQRQRELAADAKLTPADAATRVAALEAKADGPGKRRARRAIARLGPLTANAPVTPAPAQPTTTPPAAAAATPAKKGK
jgi:large subunit ribosomal protein L29